MLDSSCTRVHCSNSSLRDSFYVFCEAWNSSLWSSNSLKWNQALQVRYSSLPKLFHIAKSKLLCYWTSTHPNPHSEEYKSKLLLRHWNFNPPKPTLQAPVKRTRKHHAGVYEPPCHSKHNTAKARRFRLRFRVNIRAAITTLIKWVCWFPYGSLRVCLDLLEKKSFDCWRRRVVLAERVLKLRL